MNDLEEATDQLRQQALLDFRSRVHCTTSAPEYYAREMGIPARYQGKRLSQLAPAYHDKIMAAINATKAGHNLLIFGGIGSGKTHLASCLLWVRWKQQVHVGLDVWDEPGILNKPERSIRFCSTSDIVGELKVAKATWKREDELIEQAVTPDTLVMDDLGFEERSEMVRSWLSTILDRRYRQMKQTLITTNLTPGDLADAVDDRITSRLIESGLVVHLDGGDFRRKMAEQNKTGIYLKREAESKAQHPAMLSAPKRS